VEKTLDEGSRNPMAMGSGSLAATPVTGKKSGVVERIPSPPENQSAMCFATRRNNLGEIIWRRTARIATTRAAFFGVRESLAGLQYCGFVKCAIRDSYGHQGQRMGEIADHTCEESADRLNDINMHLFALLFGMRISRSVAHFLVAGADCQGAASMLEKPMHIVRLADGKKPSRLLLSY